jgi:soluble lytic murein transglycosylase-like protein
MRFCFRIFVGAILAAAAAYAADPPQRITTVVRSDPRSGRLVRSVIVTPKPVGSQKVAETVVAPRAVDPIPVNDAAPAPPPAPPSGIDEAVEQIAAQNSLSPEFLHSVIKVESNYNPYAVSNKGALGLMQLIPATARRFGVSNVFNPVENIQGGAKYLRYLLDLYNGNFPLALAAYNAGEAAVAKYGGIPPFKETQNYIELVGKQLLMHPAPKPAAPPAPRPDGTARIVEVVEPDGSVHYVSRL